MRSTSGAKRIQHMLATVEDQAGPGSVFRNVSRAGVGSSELMVSPSAEAMVVAMWLGVPQQAEVDEEHAAAEILESGDARR